MKHAIDAVILFAATKAKIKRIIELKRKYTDDTPWSDTEVIAIAIDNWLNELEKRYSK